MALDLVENGSGRRAPARRPRRRLGRGHPRGRRRLDRRGVLVVRSRSWRSRTMSHAMPPPGADENATQR